LAVLFGGVAPGWAIVPNPGPGGVPDYFNTPNWANSPQLRKFVDTLPGLGAQNKNNLGQYIPVAIPDKVTYPGSDYYEMEVGQFTEQMHSDMPATTLRGYRQTNTTDETVNKFHNLGPMIIAEKDRPVRIKFTNKLGTGEAGDLFIPVDTTIMGSGEFDINYNPETKESIPPTFGVFTQNRAVIHLHGGRSPWISDGTAHQWITPAGEDTDYPKGVSVAYVPDMWFDAAGNTIPSCAGKNSCSEPGATNNPGPGSQTYYWSNQQSARLMFYHDHSWGITRLNVYVGEVAGLLVTDSTEKELINAGLIPSDQIPLIVQDKTFVDPASIDATDPTWKWGSNPPARIKGDLWWPHVYMPAQNPYNPDLSGINAYGRWHYGPWFWPPTNNIAYGPVANPYYDPNCDPSVEFCQPPEMPGTPNPSWGAEAFMDTPVINGTAYPRLEVEPKAYRFRILNGSHDRFFNLQIYVADPNVKFEDRLTEVKMVPAVLTPGFPETWPTDGREGGVPDPATSGPSFIQIGTEGGFLPSPVVLPNQPINWNTDPTTFTAGIVLQQNEGGGTLMLGPAERADVIVDFSQFAGKTLILYNDAPAPWPALDPHYDYYTGAPDNRSMGGADTTLVGYGPNTRTIMQIKVEDHTPATNYVETVLPLLQKAFVSTADSPGVFARGQEPIVVGQSAYNAAYNLQFPATWPYWGLSRISDNTLSFQTVNGTKVQNFPMDPKAIQDEMGEVFDEYGRMSAKLGLEVPFTVAGRQNFVLQNFVDPATEIVADGQVQIWKITQNGVDTHPVHFHLFEVQLLNRVGWDGFMYLPDPNELGWKDTVRVSPLQDTIVALRPIPQATIPFALPSSIRPLNPAFPLGSTMGFTNINPVTGQIITPAVTNQMTNFGWEYLWHCHILSHEESDMMRPVIFNPNAQTEILWRNTVTGENKIWYMRKTDITNTAALPTIPDQSWQIVGVADFNADGKRDTLWRNTQSTGDMAGAVVVLYYDQYDYLNVDGLTITGWDYIGALPDQTWQIAGTGDFNNDGKPDIIWSNIMPGDAYSKLNVVMYMDGVTVKGFDLMSSIANVLPLFSDQNWRIVATGDFNNDGKSDIVWRNISKTDLYAGMNAIIYMDGIKLIKYDFLPSVSDQNWMIEGAGDFNEDVYTDILWRNTKTGQNMVWYMNGKTQLGTAMLETLSDTNWTIVSE
jgi:FtsP/CotA-like multicopper oxidase with cupredoxin domain